MKTNVLFSFLPLLLLALGFTSWSATTELPEISTTTTAEVQPLAPDRVSALRFLPHAAKKALRNEKIPQLKIDAKGVLTPGRGHAIVMISNGLVICPEFMITDIRRIYLDKHPSLDNVQGPAIVRCICPAGERNDCRTVEFPGREGNGNKYCMGSCDCNAVIQYLDLKTIFKSWRDLDGRWHDF